MDGDSNECKSQNQTLLVFLVWLQWIICANISSIWLITREKIKPPEMAVFYVILTAYIFIDTVSEINIPSNHC